MDLEKLRKHPNFYFGTDNGVLLHGDCLSIIPQLEPVDLVLTDPPYGIGISSNPFRQKHEKSNWDDKIPDDEIFTLIMTKSKNQIIWGGNYFKLPPSQGFLVWDKVQPENFSSAMVEMAWMSKKQPAKLFRSRVVNYSKYHPTQKPLDLFIWCLSFVGGTVLDPYIGSGTTAVACEQLNRRWIGIEISERYCEIAAKRIERERQQLKLFGPEIEVKKPTQDKLFD